MDQGYNNIINSIRKFYPVSDESIAELTGHFTPLFLPKKHLLIKGGVLDRHVYFIEKGLHPQRKRSQHMVFQGRGYNLCHERPIPQQTRI